MNFNILINKLNNDFFNIQILAKQLGYSIFDSELKSVTWVLWIGPTPGIFCDLAVHLPTNHGNLQPTTGWP